MARALETAYPDPQRILLVRLARLGDLLFTTPAIRVLRNAYPEARLDYLTTAYAAGVVEAHPAIERVLHLDRQWHRSGYRARRRQLAAELTRTRYDLAIVFEAKGATRKMLHRLLAEAGIPRVLSRDTFEGPILGSRPVHACERHLALLSMLGLPPDQASYEMHVSPAARSEAELLFREHDLSPDGGPPLVGLQAGCHYSMWPRWLFWNQRYKYHKTWPADRFARVVQELGEGLGARLLVTGAGAERRVAEQILAGVRLPAALRPVNLAGCTTVAGLAAVIERLRLFITVDTGSMHMATALGVPLIALFGPTDPARHGPYRPRAPAVVLRSDLDCSPCKKPVRKRCPRNRCMAEIPVSRVVEAAGLLLPVAPRTDAGIGANKRGE